MGMISTIEPEEIPKLGEPYRMLFCDQVVHILTRWTT